MVDIRWTGRQAALGEFDVSYEAKVNGLTVAAWVSGEAIDDHGKSACLAAAEVKIRLYFNSNKALPPHVSVSTEDLRLQP